MRNSKWRVDPVCEGPPGPRAGYRVARMRDGEYEVLAEEIVAHGLPARYLMKAKANMSMAADRANVKR